MKIDHSKQVVSAAWRTLPASAVCTAEMLAPHAAFPLGRPVQQRTVRCPNRAADTCYIVILYHFKACRFCGRQAGALCSGQMH